MKRVMICLMLALGACSAPHQDRVLPEEPTLEAPVIAEPAMIVPCLPDDVAARDGIGGTGCK